MAADTAFRRRVVAAVRRIPAGRVATYGDIAALAGRPRAWRAVGNIMRGCGDRGVPCHRVIGASGTLGGYGGHLELKRQLLRLEGIEVGRTRVRRFDQVRWPMTRRYSAVFRKVDRGVPPRRGGYPTAIKSNCS